MKKIFFTLIIQAFIFSPSLAAKQMDPDCGRFYVGTMIDSLDIHPNGNLYINDRHIRNQVEPKFLSISQSLNPSFISLLAVAYANRLKVCLQVNSQGYLEYVTLPRRPKTSPAANGDNVNPIEEE